MDSEKLQNKSKPSFVISCRFLLAILVFFGYALQYAQKIDMSVAIVCMVNHSAVLLEKNALMNRSNLTFYNQAQSNHTLIDIVDECPQSASNGKGTDGEFVWAKDLQGYILASYFYGYSLTNLLGGYLSLHFGGKYVNFFAILVGSIATLLTPISARLHFGALIAIRFITGFVHGVMWPAVASIWAHWAISEERSRLISFGNAGSQIGNVVALPLGSFLCAYGFAGGWPSIFYVFGIAGIVWCFAWFVFTADSPNSHRFIKENEKQYILNGTNISSEKIHTPWKEIFTSKACYALFIGHVCSNWGTYLFLTNIPTYMNEVLKFDIKSNGGLSALPYIVFWFVIIISGIVSDRLLQPKKGTDLSNIDEKKKIEKKRKLVRRIFNLLGYLVPMAAVIGLSFVTCTHPFLGVGLLVLGIAFIGCQYGGGFLVNYNDVCGKYAGIVLGIANTFASIPGILAPYLVGFVTKNQKQSEWQIVFLVTAGVYLIGAIALFILAEAKPEPWTIQKSKKLDDAKEEEEVYPLKNANEEKQNN